MNREDLPEHEELSHIDTELDAIYNALARLSGRWGVLLPLLARHHPSRKKAHAHATSLFTDLCVTIFYEA